MNIFQNLRALAAAAALAAGVISSAGVGVAPANATPPSTPVPTCQLEDCSDVDGGIGLWTDPDTGDVYLILPIDPIVSGGAPVVAA